MNDRFKFRIWDKKLKKLAEWGNNPYHNMEIMNYICVENPVTNWKHEDYILMQCTGLKDRNGKLIYEGDIVRLDDEYELNCIAQFHKEYDMDFGRIEFILIGGHPKCPTIYIPTVAHESAIIGNIYTTPELLEDENGN